MTVDQLTGAIVSGISSGAEQFLEGTLAAILPIIWLAILGLELGRPYILQMIERFTLRLGADLLWLIYVGLRDFLVLSGVVMSFMFLFPDVVTTDNLPLFGGLAASALFGVLLVKLMGDPDHNLTHYRIVMALVVVGGLLYFIPYVLGVQFISVAQSGPFANVSNFLVTHANPNWAVALGYVSTALFAIIGAIAAGYTLITGGRAEVPETSSTPSSGQ